MYSNVAITSEVIRLDWIKRSKSDCGILCGCQGTATREGRGIIRKESIQDNSSSRDAGLVAKRGHCKKKILV